MAKVHVNVKIESNHTKHEFHGLAMMREDRIVYYDNKVKTEVCIGNDVSIIRHTEDTLISLHFKKEVNATCVLRKEHATLPIKLELSYLKQDKNKMDIHYKLEDEIFKFHLEYEVVE